MVTDHHIISKKEYVGYGGQSPYSLATLYVHAKGNACNQGGATIFSKQVQPAVPFLRPKSMRVNTMACVY